MIPTLCPRFKNKYKFVGSVGQKSQHLFEHNTCQICNMHPKSNLSVCDVRSNCRNFASCVGVQTGNNSGLLTAAG